MGKGLSSKSAYIPGPRIQDYQMKWRLFHREWTAECSAQIALKASVSSWM
jgi:hypothetical protein